MLRASSKYAVPQHPGIEPLTPASAASPVMGEAADTGDSHTALRRCTVLYNIFILLCYTGAFAALLLACAGIYHVWAFFAARTKGGAL